MEKDVTLTKSQIDFLKLDCSFPLFCGGYGCGKSHLMGFCAVMDAMHGKGTIVGIYEPTISHIKDIAMPRVVFWLEYFGIPYKQNMQDYKITVLHPHIGNFTFKTMDDPELLVGYETYSSHLDELDTLPTNKARAIWVKILGRNRLNPSNLHQRYKVWNEKRQGWEAKNRVYTYTTPEGYKFCYEQWNNNPNPAYRIVRGRTIENPTLTDETIKNMYDAYPPNLRDAYMNGEFVNMQSSTVYSEFNREVNCIYDTVVGNETIHVACDFNVDKQVAIVIVGRGKDNWVAVDEFINMRDTPDMIDKIKQKYPNNKVCCYPDASGTSRKSVNASISDISLLKQAGFTVLAPKKNPLVKNRINSIQRAFANKSLYINLESCPTLVKSLEQQSYDKNKEPDKRSGFDHSNDALGYFVHYKMPINRPFFNIPFNFMSKH